MREGAEALGVSHRPLLRNAGACHQCSSCPNGCRIDAKRAMHVSYLPRAVAAGARVRAGVEARQIVFDGERATGVECRAGVADARAEGHPFTVRARARRGARGRGVRHPGAAAALGLQVRRAASLGATCASIRPAGSGRASTRTSAAGTGVMQSYAVDEWERRGILLEATFTPLAFGGQWLPGTGVEHQERLLAYDRIASTGVHLSDTLQRAGRRSARDGSLRISYRLTRDDAERLVFGIARAAELFYAAGAREVYPQISGMPTIAPSADRRARGLAPAALGGCGSRRFTRWAPRAWTPTRAAASPARRRGPRSRGPLRRRRQPASELDRRQPDDDHHRDGLAGRHRPRRDARLSRDGGPGPKRRPVGRRFNLSSRARAGPRFLSRAGASAGGPTAAGAGPTRRAAGAARGRDRGGGSPPVAPKVAPSSCIDIQPP